MNTSKIRQELHKLIDGIENEELLERMLGMITIEAKKHEKDDAWDCLSTEQQRELLETYEQVKTGKARLTSNEDVKKEFRNWLLK